jgi:hypothetical protein
VVLLLREQSRGASRSRKRKRELGIGWDIAGIWKASGLALFLRIYHFFTNEHFGQLVTQL